MSQVNPWREFCWFVKVIEKKALCEVIAGRFVMATIVPETLMEGGILAVLGAMVEGLTTKFSFLELVFDTSVVAALPATLFLVEALSWTCPYTIQSQQDPWQCHP